MSRIGRLPIPIPAGVTVNIADNGEVTVKGKMGELKETFHKEIKIELNVAGWNMTLRVPKPAYTTNTVRLVME